MNKTKRQKVELDWNLLPYECWSQVFLKLRFEDVQRSRQVCRTWNEWILGFKKLWPIGNKDK